jgi:hypothetical protein
MQRNIIDLTTMKCYLWYMLMSKYDVDSVYIDGANNIIKSLKLQIAEDADYDKVIASYRSEGLGDGTQDMKIVPVNFNRGWVIVK